MPIWGVLPAKITISAGLLMFAARIDLKRIEATLDPSVPVSVAGPKASALLGLPAASAVPLPLVRRREIGIYNNAYRLTAVTTNVVPRADLIVGNDLLRRMTLLVDLKRNRLAFDNDRPLSKITRGMTSVPASIDADGCLSFVAKAADGAPIRVALLGRHDPAVPADTVLAIDTFSLKGSDPGPVCRHSDAVIGWTALLGRRLLFDLAHDRLWLG